ncbi:formate dehydrogenase subunit delta [Nocardioides sp. GXQ0305]|uniref:formate dehydrogenase subunit delta n=1 Tax=Nocardioides sp. GXQ0305 TaxID=3423912 RepID=UPI003D7C7DDE
MGNDIARQFAHLGAEAAAVQIGTHLEKFWDPRMRRRLHDLLAPDGGYTDQADPLLVAGLRRLEADATDDAERRKATGG